MVRLHSGDFVGIEGRQVEVQVDVAPRGSPGFNVVGLAGKSIRESRERIRAAVSNSGFIFPHQERILVNLAPAAEEKQGSGFDLAMALGILLASGQLREAREAALRSGSMQEWGFLGEVGLDGRIRPVPGALLVANVLREAGVRRMVVAHGNAREAALVEGLEVYGADDLHEAVLALCGKRERALPAGTEDGEGGGRDADLDLDFADVKGIESTKRGLLAAAAGRHNVLLSGPPGVGKTMLARRLPGILPPMTFAEAMEVTRIGSAAALGGAERLAARRPFRAPHHTISYTGLVGGGTRLRPGEVTLAHRGVLFLDELPEFNRRALESLRQPLEEGVISIGRSAGNVQFPARFLLLAAMNPCPCGYLGHPRRSCTCGAHLVRAYRQRLSGPLLDRIDLFLEVRSVDSAELTASRGAACAGTESLRAMVRSARRLAAERWGPGVTNGEVPLDRVLKDGQVRREALDRLRACAERLGLSGRSFARLVRVSRTVADLESSARVELPHVTEALHYRQPA